MKTDLCKEFPLCMGQGQAQAASTPTKMSSITLSASTPLSLQSQGNQAAPPQLTDLCPHFEEQYLKQFL